MFPKRIFFEKLEPSSLQISYSNKAKHRTICRILLSMTKASRDLVNSCLAIAGLTRLASLQHSVDGTAWGKTQESKEPQAAGSAASHS